MILFLRHLRKFVTFELLVHLLGHLHTQELLQSSKKITVYPLSVRAEHTSSDHCCSIQETREYTEECQVLLGQLLPQAFT